MKAIKSESLKIFSSNIFLLGLFLLGINDFFLKDIFHNWFTGKLSDFSGLFVFAIFWAAFFPKYRIKVYLVVALWFVYWKSPISQPLIDGINAITFLNYQRVIDWTDLSALIVLPIAYYVQFNLLSVPRLRIPTVIPMVLASFLFMATSDDESPPSPIYLNEEYSMPFTQQVFFDRLETVDSIDFNRPKIQESTNFELTYYSPNCESYLSASVISNHISDNTSLFILSYVYTECYKEADPNKVESSITALKEEFEERVVNKLLE